MALLGPENYIITWQGFSPNWVSHFQINHEPDLCTFHDISTLFIFLKIILVFKICIIPMLKTTAWKRVLLIYFLYARNNKLWAGCFFGCSPNAIVDWNSWLRLWAPESHDKMHWSPALLIQLFSSPLAHYSKRSLATSSTRIQDLGHLATLRTHLSLFTLW